MVKRQVAHDLKNNQLTLPRLLNSFSKIFKHSKKKKAYFDRAFDMFSISL